MDKLDNAIIFSAKHAGLWTDDMSEDLRNGKITRLYITVPELKTALKQLISEAEIRAREDELYGLKYVLAEKRDDYLDLIIDTRIAALKQGKGK